MGESYFWRQRFLILRCHAKLPASTTVPLQYVVATPYNKIMIQYNVLLFTNQRLFRMFPSDKPKEKNDTCNCGFKLDLGMGLGAGSFCRSAIATGTFAPEICLHF
jgi:hypothetical protein